MKSLGDFDTSAVIYGKFTTFRPSTGAAYTLAGTPALSVYKDNSTTQSTTGVTLTADFDTVTGLNHFAIDTSADGTFYSAGSFFDIVITTGTVDSVSVVGSVVGSFTLRKNSALKPTTAGRTLDVSSTGEAGLDVANISALPAGAVPALGIVDNGTAQAATSTTLQLRSAAAFADSELIGCTILITGGTTGVGQARIITAYTGSTDTATVDTWTTTPTGTITYIVIGSPPGSTGNPVPADVKKWNGTAVSSPATAGIPEVNVKNINNVAASSVTTVNANVGTTQPVNFTGTGASALAKSDVVDVAGSAVSASSAQLGVNVVNWKGSAAAAMTGDAYARLGAPAGASVSADVAAVKTDTAAIVDDTGTSGVIVATNNDKTGYTLSNTGVDALFTRALTESYSADGAAPTVAQALFAIQQFLQERAVSGTTVTVKKLDGSTTAMTFTLNDGTSPTSLTRAT